MCSICNKRLGFKLSTINQIVEALLEQGDKEAANQATIVLKTALICEDSGIEAAMKYYNGAHGPNECIELMTAVAAPDRRISGKARYTGVTAPVGRVSSKTRSTGKSK